ncbi:hypothetical protein TNCT_650311 [Trichonephila clavata]|uniref:Uncharacterized protein n=1 Tax=Trichonephila clavata TaxID=2740835 RepID=A0A8X6J0W4_TRICU|nr:hypothetical protein TNCT_650311 [Trichonephila clavata]
MLVTSFFTGSCFGEKFANNSSNWESLTDANKSVAALLDGLRSILILMMLLLCATGRVDRIRQIPGTIRLTKFQTNRTKK